MTLAILAPLRLLLAVLALAVAAALLWLLTVLALAVAAALLLLLAVLWLIVAAALRLLLAVLALTVAAALLLLLLAVLAPLLLASLAFSVILWRRRRRLSEDNGSRSRVFLLRQRNIIGSMRRPETGEAGENSARHQQTRKLCHLVSCDVEGSGPKTV